MKKKLATLVLSAAMVAATLTGCGGDSSTTASTDSAASTDTAADTSTDTAADTSADTAFSGELIKVGIINNDPNESGYRTANDADLKATFTAENGYDASFSYSNKNEEQIAFAQTFIQNEVDYLLLSAADTAGWDSVLTDAQNAGVKVILFDRVIDADESLYEAS
ncbi:MAG: substrate-binding domain-containing protein, partial [Roseburia sp.]|nr:substrate-binding domain-containing protein [Roseburia sp.]